MIPLLLLLASLPAWADGMSVRVDLAGAWKFTTSDNPAYTEPAFDESSWTAITLPRQQLPPGGTSWYRARFTLPAEAGGRPLFLTLGTFAEIYEVWCNGVKIGDTGGRSAGQIRAARPRIFPIPKGLIEPGHSFTVALHAFSVARSGSGPRPRQLRALPDHGPYLLASYAPQEAVELGVLQRERLGVMALIFAALRALLAFMLLVAWIMERQRRDLLALTALLAADCLARYLESLGLGAWDAALSVYNSLSRITIITSSLLGWFALEVFRVRLRWSRVVVWLPAVTAPLSAAAGIYLMTLWDLAVVGLCGWKFAADARRGRLRLAPAALAVTVAAVALLHTQRVGPLATGFSYFPASGYLFHVYDVLVTLPCAGITVYLLLSFGEDRREKERLASEMDAGRTIQQTLLAAAAASAPGYEVEAAYLPALEVGGDFYWTHQEDDGGLTVLLGDVSGKGLRAAMLVSMACGVLRQAAGARPAQLLAALNNALISQTAGGVVTCYCLSFSPNGEIACANAGHPPPWKDGAPVETPPALPLGVAPGMDWEETAVECGPGECLTLVSDGVIEAANPRGELFGFDRTRTLSTQPAREIADVAQAWGQNDDITVVTVRRVA